MSTAFTLITGGAMMIVGGIWLLWDIPVVIGSSLIAPAFVFVLGGIISYIGFKNG